MKLADLQPGMKIRATRADAVTAFPQCYFEGDVFDIYEREGRLLFECRNATGPTFGSGHWLNSDRDLDDFEQVPDA